jgi:feruloyl esterase
MGAIEQWVASGTAPKQIVASHLTAGNVDKTRPLCAFPQVAKYKGAGSTDEAANFSCAMP